MLAGALLVLTGLIPALERLIARIPGDLSKTDVLEVGPGPGGLTRGLLSEGARRLASHTGPSPAVNLLTQSEALRRAGEARGFLLA